CVVDFALGSEHSCAVRGSGSVLCWGSGYSGQLGNGMTGSDAASSLPDEVMDLSDGIQITAGFEHTCALRSTGQIACWGDNTHGQLGNSMPNSTGVPRPVGVVGITDAIQVSAGLVHTCALR